MFNFLYSSFAIFLIFSCSTQNKNKKTLDYNDFQLRDVKYDSSLDSLTSSSNSPLEKETMIGRIEIKNNVDQLLESCVNDGINKSFSIKSLKLKAYVDNPILWNTLGVCYFLDKKYIIAQIYFNKALSILDNYVPALTNLGHVFEQLGQDEVAREYYKTALKYDDKALIPALSLARLRLRYGLNAKNTHSQDVNLIIERFKKILDQNVEASSFDEKLIESYLKGDLDKEINVFYVQSKSSIHFKDDLILHFYKGNNHE